MSYGSSSYVTHLAFQIIMLIIVIEKYLLLSYIALSINALLF
jgi:hypothetical protein